MSPPSPHPDSLKHRLRHNFIVLTTFQVIMRLGWIFKTESIIMPTILQSIGGTPTLLGFLPMLSRFGMAIPPVLAAPSMRRAKRKSHTLSMFAFLMGACFLGLASCWLIPRENIGASFPYIFLSIYAIFFVCGGLNHLSFGTLQGKIIPATLRGRLMLVANGLGATVAITAAYFLMPRWFHQDGADIQYVFGFTGICFVIAAIIVRFVRETPDEPDAKTEKKSAAKTDGFVRVFAALKEDRDLRRIAMMSSLGNCSIMLYPHYQALARDRMESNLETLMIWVTVQNFGTALFSSFAGSIADRFGNKVVLHWILGAVTMVPLLALGMSRSSLPPSAFSGVFFFIGMTPVFMRIVQHYTLELAAPADHPRYLAAIAICNALPFVFSGIVGYLVSVVGYEKVFLAITCIIAAAFAMDVSAARTTTLGQCIETQRRKDGRRKGNK